MFPPQLFEQCRMDRLVCARMIQVGNVQELWPQHVVLTTDAALVPGNRKIELRIKPSWMQLGPGSHRARMTACGTSCLQMAPRPAARPCLYSQRWGSLRLQQTRRFRRLWCVDGHDDARGSGGED